ncbi:unnamed protein product [Caenorhabditis brenneri]
MNFPKVGNGYRAEWEKMTTCKGIILFGGLFWALFVVTFGLYNYCAIKKPPPAVSFDDALCAEEEALIGSKSQKSSKEGSKIYIIASCEKIDHLYRRTIIEHIVISTLLSFLFPVTGFTIIANYSVIMTDKWLNSSAYPLLTVSLIVIGYLAVALLCMYSFFINFLASISMRIPYILNKSPEFILRVIVIAYGLTTSVALAVVALKSFPWYSDPIIGELIKLDPRFYKITLEKSINIIIIPNGMYHILVGLIVNCVGFIPFSVISITGLPITLLISVPLQLFPILDCLLNIFMITVYRQKGYLLFKNAITGLLEAQKRRRSSINPEKI